MKEKPKKLTASEARKFLDDVIDAIETLSQAEVHWGEFNEDEGDYDFRSECCSGSSRWEKTSKHIQLFCSGNIGSKSKRIALSELARAVGTTVYDGSRGWDFRTRTYTLQYDYMHDHDSHCVSFMYAGVEFFVLEDLTFEHIQEAKRIAKTKEEAENEGVGN